MRRRTALAALAGGAVLLLGPVALRRLRAPDLATEPLAGLPGFRKLAGGNLSGGDPMLIGLGDGASATPDEVCAHLFDGPSTDQVPIAYFSDARCVYCRVMSPLLHEIAEAHHVRITWHELPLLGPTSTRAAQASLAARRQGAYAMFHDRLMGTPFLPNEAYLRQLATEAGIDADRLLRDMTSDAVQRTLTRTARIARAFGFFGTPALVVGRTALLGAVEPWQLRRLIADERAAPGPHPCA
jgi:protein-disulfide isomerase